MQLREVFVSRQRTNTEKVCTKTIAVSENQIYLVYGSNIASSAGIHCATSQITCVEKLIKSDLTRTLLQLFTSSFKWVPV